MTGYTLDGCLTTAGEVYSSREPCPCCLECDISPRKCLWTDDFRSTDDGRLFHSLYYMSGAYADVDSILTVGSMRLGFRVPTN